MPNPLNQQFKYDEMVYQEILGEKRKGEPENGCKGADPYDNKLWKDHRVRMQECLKRGWF